VGVLSHQRSCSSSLRSTTPSGTGASAIRARAAASAGPTTFHPLHLCTPPEHKPAIAKPDRS
jgi:hypothetical protein